MSYTPQHFACWFEIPVTDLEASKAFYSTVFDMELKRLFISRGGLDATDAIDTRSSGGRYTRRRSMLENEDHLLEGIQLAFHPMIVMEDWPGNP